MAINTNVTVWATTTVVLTADAWREQVFLQNDSNEDIYLAFGWSAVLNKWMVLPSTWKVWVNFEQIVDKTLLSWSINAICASWSKNLLVIYS